MAPLPAMARIALLRKETTRAPSSRDSAPATTAAAISPCEWPSTASGSTPTERHSSASDTITAQSAGWTTSTRSNASASPRTSASDQSTNGSSAASHAAIERANTGDQSSRSRVIPVHWAPWPGKTNTTLPPSPAASPTTSSRRPASSSARSAPTTTARWSNDVRVRSSDAPTSAGSASARAGNRAACSRTASAVRADSTHGRTRAGTSTVPTGSSGASASTAWALVPDTPNDDTPASRGRSADRGHGRGSVSRARCPRDQSTRDEGASTCSVRGSSPCRSASTVLITPTTPAAAWVWPTFDFSDPSHAGRAGSRS